MKTYIVGFHNGYDMEVVLFETASLKAALGEYNRHTRRTRWTNAY